MSETAPPPQGQEGLHGRLVAGTAGKGLTLAVSIGEQFLLVPVFLLFWGAELYGDWLALLAAAGFLVLLDLGLQTYYANAMQIAVARGDAARFTRLLHQAFGVYGAILAGAAPLVLAAILLAPWQDWLNLGGRAAPDARLVLALVAAHMLIALPFGVLVSVYRAYGRFATAIMVGNAVRLLLIGAVAAALWAGGGIAGVAVVYIAVSAISWAAVTAHQKRLFPGLRYGFALPGGVALRDAATIAPLYGLIPVAMALTVQGAVVLVAALGAAGSAVATYTTLRTLAGAARLASDQITQVTGVEMARQYAQDDGAALTRLYDFTARLTGGLSGALGGLIAAVAAPFLALWTLGRIDFDGNILWPLLAAGALSGPSLAAASLLHCINRPRGMAAAHLGAGVVVVVLAALLIPRLGAAGAAWGVLAAELCILSVALPVAAAREVGGSALRRIAVGHGCAALAFAASFALARGAAAVVGSDTLWRLALVGLIWAALSAPPLFYLLFTPGQRRWILDRARAKATLA